MEQIVVKHPLMTEMAEKEYQNISNSGHTVAYLGN
jgi:hypothetical protein